MMNCELFGRVRIIMEVLSRHFPGETEEHQRTRQYRRCPDDDSNQRPAKYKSMASPLFKLHQLTFETKSVFTEEQNTV